jgi:hypothetical protein
MATRTGAHDFDCDPETFWARAFFSEEFNRKLFLERLKFEQWEVLEQVETADGFRRRVKATPRVGDLPGPIKTLLKNGTGYVEEGEYFRSQSRYVINVIPSSLADRLKITGDMRVVPLPDGRCRRSYTTVVEAKIMVVGGMLETRLLDDIDKSYARSTLLTQEMLKEAKPAT